MGRSGVSLTIEVTNRLVSPGRGMEEIVGETQDLGLCVTNDEGMKIAVRCHDASPSVHVLGIREDRFVECEVLAPDLGPFGEVAVFQGIYNHGVGVIR